MGMIEDEKMLYLEKIKSILTLCEKKKILHKLSQQFQKILSKVYYIFLKC